MKKLLALSLAIGMVPSLTFARGNHPMAGCGLGYLLLSNKDNEKVTQVVGATTNGTFGSQTFGISSGTSGCTEDGAVKMARATEVFAEVNLDSLRQEMAAKVEDVLLRRSGLNWLAATKLREAAPRVAEMCAARLGWSRERRDAEINSFTHQPLLAEKS